MLGSTLGEINLTEIVSVLAHTLELVHYNIILSYSQTISPQPLCISCELMGSKLLARVDHTA